MVRKAHGFALIDLLFVCGIIGVLSAMALPRLTTARQSAAAASAIGSMRAINSAQLTFALTCGGGFYAPNLSTLGKPPAGTTETFIGGGLGAADPVQKSGYTISVSATAFAGAPDTCNAIGPAQTGQGFKAAADPIDQVSNSRFFATNANGVIYEDTATLTVTMPEIGLPAAGHPLR